MFNVTLVRNSQPQETIEVQVLDRNDELFFKRNGIQIDLEDHTFKISLVAKLADGRKVSVDKIRDSMTNAFATLAKNCKIVLATPLMVH